MSTRLSGSLLLLIALVLLLNAGSFFAQDPQQPTPAAAPATAPDLSGTYAGTFNCESIGLMGDTTLTITGNQFTTADGKSGRIVTSKNGRYTAVALQVGEATGTTPAQIVSLRARKYGNRLTLMSAPEASMKCSFTSTATARRKSKTPAAAGTEVSNPATAPAPVTTPMTPTPETPVPVQTPAPSPTPMPSPTTEPTPEPNPSPQPNPSPMPSPEPNPTPMPTPTATPSPTPSATPSPVPRG